MGVINDFLDGFLFGPDAPAGASTYLDAVRDLVPAATTPNTPAGGMKPIECVITCVDYGDFLAATLPTNRNQFHYTVVATTPEDVRTQKVCEHWNVHCVVTDAFHAGGGFRKGAGVNAALDTLRKLGRGKGFVAHMDADIFLPPLAMEHVGRADLDPTFLYGLDRMMVRSFGDWWGFLANPAELQHEDRVYVHPRPFAVGTRIATPDPLYRGYVPIGFFQMWSPSASGVWEYPAEHTDAGRGDMVFAAKWPRNRRGFIPEVIAYHLESAHAEMGANWHGRKTPQFGPSPLKAAH